MSTEPETETHSTPAATTGDATAEVLFYARPGCPFCTWLRGSLKQQGLAFRELDIWQDPAAAAAVRAAANGNETVPTINVGDTWLVNPSAEEVLAAVAAEAPALLPAGAAAKPGLLGRIFGKGE